MKLLKINSTSKILNLGLPDEFIEHGDQDQQKTINGLDGEGMKNLSREKLTQSEHLKCVPLFSFYFKIISHCVGLSLNFC